MKSAATTLLVALVLVLVHAGTAAADISPELGAVPVDGPIYRTVKTRYDETAAALAAATADRTGAESEIARLTAEDAALTTRIAADTAARDAAANELTEARHNVKVIAVTAYVRGNTDIEEIDLDSAEEVAAALDAQSHQIVFGTVQGGQIQRTRDAQAAHDAAAKRRDDGIRQQADVRDQLAHVTDGRDRAADDEVRLTDELARRAIELADARATAMVVGVDFTLVALDAYHRAATTMAATKPQCGIPWWALAGIGRVESKHGRDLQAAGDTTHAIIGIPLDGNNGTQLIPDTDGGELDGDIEFDRAVGPMQFIPSTWRRWASDGNNDGQANPHNMYDAALSAARYLCAGGPMTTDEEMTLGFLRYNHSGDYATSVLSFAHQYEALVIPPPV